MPTAKQCLFGGAIFAAGLTAHALAAPDTPIVVGPYGYSMISYAYLPGFDFIETLLGDPCSHAPIVGVVIENGIASFTGMKYFVDDTPEVEAYAQYFDALAQSKAFSSAYNYVDFTEPTEVLCEWDLPEDGGCAIFSPGFASVEAGVWRQGPSTGSQTFLMEPGQYILSVLAESSNGQRADAKISVGADPPCFCDTDANTLLNVDDIENFVAAFLGADLAGADCDANAALNVDDIECFVDCFLASCP